MQEIIFKKKVSNQYHITLLSIIKFVNDSGTDKKITADNINNNYFNFYTEMILYMCVWATTYTPSPTKST